MSFLSSIKGLANYRKLSKGRAALKTFKTFSIASEDFNRSASAKGYKGMDLFHSNVSDLFIKKSLTGLQLKSGICTLFPLLSVLPPKMTNIFADSYLSWLEENKISLKLNNEADRVSGTVLLQRLLRESLSNLDEETKEIIQFVQEELESDNGVKISEASSLLDTHI